MALFQKIGFFTKKIANERLQSIIHKSSFLWWTKNGSFKSPAVPMKHKKVFLYTMQIIKLKNTVGV
jgi:hypothetical protein